MQDSLTIIKKVEEETEEEVESLKARLARDEEKRILLLEEREKEVEKNYKEKLVDIRKSLSPVFKKMDEERDALFEKEKESLEKKAFSNTPSFIKEVIEKIK